MRINDRVRVARLSHDACEYLYRYIGKTGKIRNHHPDIHNFWFVKFKDGAEECFSTNELQLIERRRCFGDNHENR